MKRKKKKKQKNKGERICGFSFGFKKALLSLRIRVWTSLGSLALWLCSCWCLLHSSFVNQDSYCVFFFMCMCQDLPLKEKKKKEPQT